MAIEEKIIFYCALALVSMSVLFLITILFSRMQKTARIKRYEEMKDGFQKRLNSFLIVGNVNGDNINPFSWRYLLDDFRHQLSGNFQKQLLIDLLISNKKNLSGHSGEMLRKVYIRLQLKGYSRAKLKHRRAHIKVKGLKELAEMGCTDALPEIQVLLKSRNQMVSEESFIAMVRLGGATSFNLVREYKGLVTLWMQLLMQKHLSSLRPEKVPKFHYWFGSSNAAVRKFAIRMTCHFKQFESLPGLASMLKDSDIEIAGLASWALGEMGADQYASAIEKLGMLYILDEPLSLSVIQALGHIGKPLNHLSYYFPS